MRSLLDQTARHYQGQQSNLAMGAEGGKHFQGVRLPFTLLRCF
jgi:hypothetical protein